MMSKVQHIIRNNSSKVMSLLDQSIVSGSNFLLAILISTLGSVELYGEFSLIWLGFLFLHGAFTSYTGMSFLVLAQKEDDADLFCSNNMILVNRLIIILLPIFILIAISVQFSTSWFTSWTTVICAPTTILLYVKHEQHRRFYFAKDHKLNVIFIDIITYILPLPLIAGLYFVNALSLSNIFLGLMITALLSNILFHIKSGEPFTIKSEQLPWRKNWDYGKYLLATNIAQWSSSNYLLIAVSVLLGAKAVGIIRMIQNIMGILHIFFITLENVVPAKASFLLHQHSANHFKTYMRAVARKSSIFFLAVLGAMFFFKTEIINLIYGQELMQFDYIFAGFIGLYVLVFIGTLLQIYLKTIEKNQGLLLAYIVSTVVSLLSANYLIENYHLTGYIIGLVTFQLISIATYLVYLRKVNLSL